MRIAEQSKVVIGTGLILALLVTVLITILAGLASVNKAYNTSSQLIVPILKTINHSTLLLFRVHVELVQFDPLLSKELQSELKEGLEGSLEQYKQALATLIDLSRKVKESLPALNVVKASSDTMSALILQLFNSRQEKLNLTMKSQAVYSDFVILVDKLDSLIFDLSESTDAEDSVSALQNLSGQLREIRGFVDIARQGRKLSELEQIINEVSLLVGDVSQYFFTITENRTLFNLTQYEAVKEHFLQFKKMLDGLKNPLQIYKKLLLANQLSSELLVKIDELFSQTRTQFSQLVEETNVLNKYAIDEAVRVSEVTKISLWVLTGLISLLIVYFSRRLMQVQRNNSK